MPLLGFHWTNSVIIRSSSQNWAIVCCSVKVARGGNKNLRIYLRQQEGRDV